MRASATPESASWTQNSMAEFLASSCRRILSPRAVGADAHQAQPEHAAALHDAGTDLHAPDAAFVVSPGQATKQLNIGRARACSISRSISCPAMCSFILPKSNPAYKSCDDALLMVHNSTHVRDRGRIQSSSADFSDPDTGMNREAAAGNRRVFHRTPPQLIHSHILCSLRIPRAYEDRRVI